MPRHAKLRDKDGYWTSDARGRTTRFGRVSEVSYAEALGKFREFLAQPEVKHAFAMPTVRTLADHFLEWVRDNRSPKSLAERSRHIGRFVSLCGKEDSGHITLKHLEAFVERLVAAGYAPDYVQKHVVSIRAMFNRGVRKGWILSSVRPFAHADPIRRTPKVLGEAKLPTVAEIRKLFAAADVGGNDSIVDILRMFHATGARTGELVKVRATDFQPYGRQIILANHKRSHTLTKPTPRTIALNPVAHDIMARRTQGLHPLDLVFRRASDGKAHSANSLAKRFEVVRKWAGVRRDITIYSFRHLWISEALMAGIDLILVARMAGTSVHMIESTYGHFRSQNYREAQERLDAARTARGL